MQDLVPDLETAIARLAATLLPDEVAKDAYASQAWPGWFSDQQIAAEHAQKLARELGAAVNASLLAQNWLAQKGRVTRHRRGVPKKRKRRKKRRQARRQQQARRQVPQQPAQQQQAPSPPQPVTTTRPAPRQYLNAAGVTAALYAVLLAILAALWAAAFALGWASAIAILGLGQMDGAQEALAELQAEGEQRLHWILQTRMRRLEQVLMQALREDWSAERLAQAIMDILSSLTAALLVAISELTWASAWAAYWVYKFAGVKWVRWQTRNDGLVCQRCMANQKASPVRLGQRFPSGDLRPLAHPRCRCALLPSGPPKPQKGTVPA